MLTPSAMRLSNSEIFARLGRRAAMSASTLVCNSATVVDDLLYLQYLAGLDIVVLEVADNPVDPLEIPAIVAIGRALPNGRFSRMRDRP